MLLQGAQHEAALKAFKVLFETMPTSQIQLHWMQEFLAEAEREKPFNLSAVATAMKRSPSAASKMSANFEELLLGQVEQLGLLDDE